MIQIIDRRFDSKNKSSVNRSRFLRRFRGEIKQAVTRVINRDSVKDMDSGKKVRIPARNIAEPQFRHGAGGAQRHIHPGNDRFIKGDELDRPAAGQGQGSQASPDGEGTDAFEFTLSRDEFLEYFFEELALPNLVKRHLGSIREYRWHRAGFTQTGAPNNLSLVRTMRGATARRLATRSPCLKRLNELEAELERRLQAGGEDSEVLRLRQEIARLRTRIRNIPFVDTFDLRYRNRVRVPRATLQAVMFCLMDVSGSMDENRKNIAKRFFTLLYLFLLRNYERIDVVFIRHDTTAEEVDEEQFFHSQKTGGTIVSSALKLMLQVAGERYPAGLWNLYGAQASDGDDWQDDAEPCRRLLEGEILPLVQHYAYIEIADSPQGLWKAYERVQEARPDTFAMRRIRDSTDIWPVFHDLFKKRA